MEAIETGLKVGTVWINGTGKVVCVTEIIRNDGKIRTVNLDHYVQNQWKNYSQTNFSSFIREYRFVEGDWKEWKEKAAQILLTGDVAQYLNNDSEITENDETGLIAAGQKELLKGMRDKIEARKKEVDLIRLFLAREIDEAHNKMLALKETLARQVELMNRQVEKLQRVIDVIELYLGINESIVVIKEGKPASKESDICFRQLVLFMDEEVGAWQSGGLDYNDITEFDEWLQVPANLQQVLPEEKGLVVFKPRRFEKTYYPGDPMANRIANIPNHYTYVLIRNGENLYRVFGELEVGARLFPKRGEFEELLGKIADLNAKGQGYYERQADEVEKEVYRYKRWAFVFQGLIDRTEIFYPIVDRISIFNLDSDSGVRFIYDDDVMLTEGRLPFWKYVKEINSKIERGTRVLLTGEYGGYGSRKDLTDRLFYYCSEYNAPKLPAPGLYTVEERDNPEFEKNYGYRTDEPKVFYILHNPQDEVYGSWGDYDPHERKKRIGWKIYKNDRFIMNYDLLSLDDIEFYLKSRINRIEYAGMMPLLQGLKERRLEEMKYEAAFVDMLQGRALNAVNLEKFDAAAFRAFCWECIEWWKRKVIWKRPITGDDEKALRMIESRIFAKSNEKRYLK